MELTQFTVDQIPSYLTKLNISLFSGRIEIGELCEYNVRGRWFSKKDAQIPNASKNGIYLYTNPDKEILYIGKAEYSSGDGIGYRSCAHLGGVKRDSETMFPHHQWANADIDPNIKKAIESGEFLIWTLPICPDHFISFIETFLQTLCFDLCGTLPPLNRKIG